MQRFSVLALLLLLSFPVGLSVVGCASNPANFCSSDIHGPRLTDVATINLEPRTFGLSLQFAQTGGVGSPQPLNCRGTAVTPRGKFAFGITGDNTIADINPANGSLCAGRWNRNTGNGVPDFSICNPTNKTGTVTVTANVDGASSNGVTVFVHPQVAKTTTFTESACDPNNPSSNCCPQAIAQQTTPVPIYTGKACLSQNTTAQLAIQAFDAQGNNITCSVGHFVFTPAVQSTTGGVQPTVVKMIDQNGVVTADQPGTVNITAAAGNASSAAGSFSTCPPASISLTGPVGTGTGTDLTININNTRQLQAKVVDTMGNPITGLALTYTSTLPLEIPVTPTIGSVTPRFPSTADITAACLPPTCNTAPFAQIGLFGTGKPVYSNPVQINTPGTDSSLLYLSSTQSPSFVVIDFTSPLPPSPVRLPFTPNSMVLSQDGTTLYFGSSTELMTVSTTSNSLTAEDLNVPGKVLAVSPDNTQVLISDPSRGVFYLYSVKSKTFQSFGGTGNHAQWSTDGTTIYIAGGNAMYIFNTFTGFHTFDAPEQANDVAITVPAVAGFFAGTTTTARSACPDTSVTPPDFYPIAAQVPARTDRIAATNDGNHILGVATGDLFTDIDVTIPRGACPANSGLTIPAQPFQTTLAGVNASTFNAVVPSPDSTLAAISYNPAGGAAGAPLPVYHVPASGLGTVKEVPLADGATAPVSTIFSPDGTTIFAGTSGDDRVHVISVPAFTDDLQIKTNLVNLSNQPVPADLIAVRPRPIT